MSEPTHTPSSIQSNLEQILAQVQMAAQAANRDPKSVKLIAVSKTKPMALIQEAFAAGQLDFGENRVQELREKQPELPEAHWHLIGSLQRNKVKYIAEWVHLIHSVDSERLLAEIDKQAAKYNRMVDCLLQLNISDEEAKSGLDEVSTADLLTRIDDYPHVRIKGLMGMAMFTEDEAIVRQAFRRLRLAKESLAAIEHPRLQLEELSMGMSGDFQIAIEEGSTMVRIGSAIFGRRG